MNGCRSLSASSTEIVVDNLDIAKSVAASFINEVILTALASQAAMGKARLIDVLDVGAKSLKYLYDTPDRGTRDDSLMVCAHVPDLSSCFGHWRALPGLPFM